MAPTPATRGRFFLGLPSLWATDWDSRNRGQRNNISGAFVQDDWRITPRLTFEFRHPLALFTHLRSALTA